MLLDQPDVFLYADLLDEAALAKDELIKLDYIIENTIASYIKQALDAGCKTKVIDYVKHIGNTDEQKENLIELKEAITTQKTLTSRAYNKVKVWEMSKDLYISDNYHVTKGNSAVYAQEEINEESGE